MAPKVFIFGFSGVFVTLATFMPGDIDFRLHQHETIHGKERQVISREKGRSGDGSVLFQPHCSEDRFRPPVLGNMW